MYSYRDLCVGWNNFALDNPSSNEVEFAEFYPIEIIPSTRDIREWDVSWIGMEISQEVNSPSGGKGYCTWRVLITSEHSRHISEGYLSKLNGATNACQLSILHAGSKEYFM